MTYAKLVFYGQGRAFKSLIDLKLFPWEEFDGPRDAERAVNQHVADLLRQQTAEGVPLNADVKARRRAYRRAHDPRPARNRVRPTWARR